MTREERELLFKDLCGRLPYGVRIDIPDLFVSTKNNIEVLNEIFCGDDGEFRCNDSGMLIKHVKSYLFPLSSLTKEQRKELFYLSGIDIIYGKFYTNSEFTLEETLSGINWLLKNHFDINSLIPMGLAIDATGLNIYE